VSVAVFVGVYVNVAVSVGVSALADWVMHKSRRMTPAKLNIETNRFRKNPAVSFSIALSPNSSLKTLHKPFRHQAGKQPCPG